MKCEFRIICAHWDRKNGTSYTMEHCVSRFQHSAKEKQVKCPQCGAEKDLDEIYQPSWINLAES